MKGIRYQEGGDVKQDGNNKGNIQKKSLFMQRFSV